MTEQMMEPQKGDDLEYPRGYRSHSIIQQMKTRSEALEEELTTRSQRTSDFIWRIVVITLLLLSQIR